MKNQNRTIKYYFFCSIIVFVVVSIFCTLVEGRHHAFETNEWKLTQKHGNGRRSQLADHRRALSDLVDVQKPNGDDGCPCLSYEELNGDSSEFSAELIDEQLTWDDLSGGYAGSIEDYGVGCNYHDIGTKNCSSATCATQIPLANNCDLSWCARAFCYVDPNKCQRLNRPSQYFKHRSYSYATCGFMNSFTSKDRLKTLEDRNFRVGFNSNSGGWKGAYNPEGSFAVNDQWTGPMVEFLQHAAQEGKFEVTITAPPEWLRNESKKFFGGSSFDYCVYATALGYLDLCVSAYTITDKRASVTPFFETYSDPIYLVTIEEATKSGWESFLQSFKTIFQPFTPEAWILIWFVVLPVLAACMLFHEYQTPGSVFPTTRPVLRINKDTGSKEIDNKKIPLRSHMGHAFYTTVLSLFTEYDQSVISLGGKINVIALVSFNLTILAVYTANLAAILTQEIQVSTVHNLNDAIKAGYNFCAERKVAELVSALHNIDMNTIVPDPEDLGGDGLPGFNCPNCAARNRVFDYMRAEHSDNSLYCNAAFASLEDLEVLQNQANHCNKKIVGAALAYQTLGFPVFDKEADGLVSLLYSVKYNGAVDKYLSGAEPVNRCPSSDSSEGSSLTIQQLTGVWVLTFGLALVGIIITLIEKYRHKKAQQRGGEMVVHLQRCDQWGHLANHDIVIDGHKFDPSETTLRPLGKSVLQGGEFKRLSLSNRSLLDINTSRPTEPTLDSTASGALAYPRASSIMVKIKEDPEVIGDDVVGNFDSVNGDDDNESLHNT